MNCKSCNGRGVVRVYEQVVCPDCNGTKLYQPVTVTNCKSCNKVYKCSCGSTSVHVQRKYVAGGKSLFGVLCDTCGEHTNTWYPSRQEAVAEWRGVPAGHILKQAGKRTLVVPCPVCADEEGKPTGQVTIKVGKPVECRCKTGMVQHLIREEVCPECGVTDSALGVLGEALAGAGL